MHTRSQEEWYQGRVAPPQVVPRKSKSPARCVSAEPAAAAVAEPGSVADPPASPTARLRCKSLKVMERDILETLCGGRDRAESPYRPPIDVMSAGCFPSAGSRGPRSPVTPAARGAKKAVPSKGPPRSARVPLSKTHAEVLARAQPSPRLMHIGTCRDEVLTGHWQMFQKAGAPPRSGNSAESFESQPSSQTDSGAPLSSTTVGSTASYEEDCSLKDGVDNAAPTPPNPQRRKVDEQLSRRLDGLEAIINSLQKTRNAVAVNAREAGQVAGQNGSSMGMADLEPPPLHVPSWRDQLQPLALSSTSSVTSSAPTSASTTALVTSLSPATLQNADRPEVSFVEPTDQDLLPPRPLSRGDSCEESSDRIGELAVKARRGSKIKLKLDKAGRPTVFCTTNDDVDQGIKDPESMYHLNSITGGYKLTPTKVPRRAVVPKQAAKPQVMVPRPVLSARPRLSVHELSKLSPEEVITEVPEWGPRLDNLATRFSDKPTESVLAALIQHDGHAGRASATLMGVEESPRQSGRHTLSEVDTYSPQPAGDRSVRSSLNTGVLESPSSDPRTPQMAELSSPRNMNVFKASSLGPRGSQAVVLSSPETSKRRTLELSSPRNMDVFKASSVGSRPPQTEQSGVQVSKALTSGAQLQQPVRNGSPKAAEFGHSLTAPAPRLAAGPTSEPRAQTAGARGGGKVSFSLDTPGTYQHFPSAGTLGVPSPTPRRSDLSPVGRANLAVAELAWRSSRRSMAKPLLAESSAATIAEDVEEDEQTSPQAAGQPASNTDGPSQTLAELARHLASQAVADFAATEELHRLESAASHASEASAASSTVDLSGCRKTTAPTVSRYRVVTASDDEADTMPEQRPVVSLVIPDGDLGQDIEHAASVSSSDSSSVIDLSGRRSLIELDAAQVRHARSRSRSSSSEGSSELDLSQSRSMNARASRASADEVTHGDSSELRAVESDGSDAASNVSEYWGPSTGAS